MKKKAIYLRELSTFGIGGLTNSYVEVTTTQELQEVLSFCREQNHRFFVVGNGSNCLFDDSGFDGVIIKNNISFCEHDGEVWHVGAGYNIAILSRDTVKAGFSGLEFAIGIPASVGGAVVMNCSAYGMGIGHCVEKVEYFDGNGILHSVRCNDIKFEYRNTSLKNVIVTAVKLRLRVDKDVGKRQKEIIRKRRNSQPYGKRSAGCIFRNPEGKSAGKLIESVGLKGFSIGGAQISPKHANFIINVKDASSSDVLALIEKAKNKVKEIHGIDLEREIQYVR